MDREELMRRALEDLQQKRDLRDDDAKYYAEKAAELSLDDVEGLSTYLPGGERFFERGIIFAQKGMDTVVDAIFEEREWAVVSGLNPSGPLHFGHKAMFDVLLWLQKSYGAHIYIPITDDESYLVGKQPSLKQARETALNEVIPSIIALGFDPAKTKILLHSAYPPISQLAIAVSRHTTYNNVRGLFGWEGHENPGIVFYMGGLQFASILMPQLDELGGPRPVLVPVGIDQHPYISLARDVARKLHIVPPSEMIWKFLPGLRHPGKKMSASVPGDAIFLTDSPEDARDKIRRCYSGGASYFEAHRLYGAVPEVCSAFNLLTYNMEDQEEWRQLHDDYAAGKLLVSEVKALATDMVSMILKEHADRRADARQRLDEFLMDDPLPSVTGTDTVFSRMDGA
jgi:tryptophanyl-tRNA synthetase